MVPGVNTDWKLTGGELQSSVIEITDKVNKTDLMIFFDKNNKLILLIKLLVTIL